MRRTFELDTQRLKLRILKIAHDEDLDSDVLVAALADVLGLTAATLDMKHGPQSLDERLAAFVERVKDQHRSFLARAANIPRVG